MLPVELNGWPEEHEYISSPKTVWCLLPFLSLKALFGGALVAWEGFVFRQFWFFYPVDFLSSLELTLAS